MSKNETHNHPTEIELFGGAASVLVELFVIQFPLWSFLCLSSNAISGA